MKFLITFVLLLASLTATAATVNYDMDRTFRLTTKIDGNTAQAFDDFARGIKGEEPVWIYISSPGGSVVAGYFILNSIAGLHERGIKVNCMVKDFAASMAFHIYAACDERYSLPYSVLLWHEIRAVLMTTMSPEEADHLAFELYQQSEPLDNILIEKLGIDKDAYRYHNRMETLWLASALIRFAPHFDIQIVNRYVSSDPAKEEKLIRKEAEMRGPEDQKKPKKSLRWQDIRYED